MFEKHGITIIILIGAIVLSFFIGRCTSGDSGETSVIVVRDTLHMVFIKEVVVRDTITKKRVVSIPREVDSSYALNLIAQRDSLAGVLAKQNVKSIAILDTIHWETKDTINVKYDEFLRHWDLRIGFMPREVRLQTQTLYLPAPKREWWDNPFVGFLAGGIIGAGATLVLTPK